MLVYLILLAVVVTGCFMEISKESVKILKKEVEIKTICFIVIYTYVIFLALFRYEFLGADSENYFDMFMRFKEETWSNILFDITKDNGFWLLIKIIGLFTNSFWVFRTTIFIIFFSLFSYVLYKNVKHISLAYLVYFGLGFLQFDLCILRQSIAVIICFIAFKYVKEKKILKFTLLVLLAATFHKTAVLYWMVYPISNVIIKISKFKFKIFLEVLFVGGSFLALPILYVVYKKIYSIDYMAMAVHGEGLKLLAFYVMVYIGIGYLYSNSDKKLSQEYDSAFCAILFQSTTPFFSLFTRMTNYFTPFFAVLLSNLLYEKKKIYRYLVILIFSGMYMYVLLTDYTEMVPYISVFTK